MFGRLGLDYFVTNRTTLSLAAIRVHGEFKPTTESDITTDSILNDGTLRYNGTRTSNGTRTFNATGVQLGMVHNFAKDGEQLTADGNFFSGKNSGDQMYLNNSYDANGNFIGTSTQQQLSDGTNQFLTIQTDYTNPLTKKTKLEAGLRAQLNKIENDNQTYYVYGAETSKVPGTEIAYHNDQ